MHLKNFVFQFVLSIAIFVAMAFYQAPMVFAFDAGNFLEKLEATAKARGDKFSYADMEETDDGFVLNDVSIEKDDGSSETTIEKLTTTGAEGTGEGGLKFDTLEILKLSTIRDRENDGDESETDNTISIETLTLLDVEFTFAENEKKLSGLSRISSVEGSGLEFARNSKSEPVKLNSDGFMLEKFERDGETAARFASFVMQPISGTVDRQGRPMEVAAEGLSITGFQRFSETGFNIENLTVDPVTLTGKDKNDRKIEFFFEGGNAENLYSGDPLVEDQPLVSEKPLSIKIGRMNAKLDGKDFLGWDAITAQNIYDPVKNASIGGLNFSNLYLDFSGVPEKEASKEGLRQLREMGYEKIFLQMVMDGTWNLSSGDVVVEKLRTEIKDAGAIEMGVEFSGYTEGFVRKLARDAAAVREMKEQKEGDAQQLANMQMLATLSSVILRKLSISIEDASLLNKVLALQAAQVNQQPEDLSAIVGPMATVMLAPYNIPDFAASVTTALNTFMKGNKTITATAEPADGLVVTEVIALSSGVQAGHVSPADLLKRLNVTIVAE